MKTFKADCKSSEVKKQLAFSVQIARTHELAAASKQNGRSRAALHL